MNLMTVGEVLTQRENSEGIVSPRKVERYVNKALKRLAQGKASSLKVAPIYVQPWFAYNKQDNALWLDTSELSKVRSELSSQGYGLSLSQTDGGDESFIVSLPGL